MTPRAWGAGGLVVLLVLATGGCDAGTESASDATSSSPASSSPAPSGSTHSPGADRLSALHGVPRLPQLGDPARLAEQLRRVVEVLTSPRSAAPDVRRAAHFEQLAARTLAAAPAARTQSVLARLDGAVGGRTRRHVEAAALLDSMTTPEAELPRWRIVAPPAASELLGHYRFAGQRIGVPWEYLAAIHLVETRMGRIRGVSSAGARGPMQFLLPTWDLYGEGGDINDPRDAILAAARLLRANGAPGDMREAVWHYNPSDSYVGAVTSYAEQLQRDPATYRSYWHWRVLYKHVDGTKVLEVGYPEVRARPLP